MQLITLVVNRQTGALIFSYKSMFPTLTHQILLKVNEYDEFTQYMLEGSWVKVGNILSKNIEKSPFVYLQSEILSVFCTLLKIVRRHTFINC